MSMRKITAPSVPEPPGGIYSNCLVVGDQVFLAGMTASGADGAAIGGADVYEQSRAVLAKVRALLEAAGSSLRDVVKLTVYLTDVSQRAAFGRARLECFDEPRPCSTLLEVKALVAPDLLVEVDAVAVRGAGAR
jgi:enamine deaminase RidA (YjgF/YER057c/UK114 family)